MSVQIIDGMDEQIFYIRENLLGIWENNAFLFDFSYSNKGDLNLVSITDKTKFLKTGSGGIFYLVKQDYIKILRVVLHSNDTPIQVMDFRIDEFNYAIGRMTLSNGGVSISLQKVA